MKSLKERQKQRAEMRAEALKTSPFAAQYAQEAKQKEADQELETDLSKLTIDQLKDHAKKLGTEVPADKTKKEDVLEFVKNLVEFKKNEAGGENPANAWKAGN